MIEAPQTVSTDAPPLPSLPTGRPLAAIRIGALPSLNEIIEKVVYSPYAVTAHIKSERRRGRKLAVAYAREAGITTTRRIVIDRHAKTVRGDLVETLERPLTANPVFIIVHVYRREAISKPGQADKERDTINALVKGLIDGLVDAGLLLGDSDNHIPDFWVHFAGLAKENTGVMVFYEQ